MQSPSKRKRAAPVPAIPSTSQSESPPPADASTDSESPSLTRPKRRRSNPRSNPRTPSSAASLSSPEAASQRTYEEQKTLAKVRIAQYKFCNREHEDSLVRTLEAALEKLPVGGRDELAKDIIKVDEDDDQTLWEVYSNFRTAVMNAFRSTGKTSATPSPHDSRRASVERVAAKLPEPQTRSSAWAQGCMDRDGSRCVISGAVSESVWTRQGAIEGQLWDQLEVHHVIPFSLAGFDSKDHRNAAMKWGAIYTAFPKLIEIRPSTINCFDNGITLSEDVHKEFQEFRLALEPIDGLNTYRVKTYPRFKSSLYNYIRTGITITLVQAPVHKDKPLPNPDFLDAHFRLCEIWHISRFAEEVTLNTKRWDRLKQESSGRMICEDGSTDLDKFMWIAFSAVPQSQYHEALQLPRIGC